MEGLRSLTSLELEDMPGLDDARLSQVSALTALTNLGVVALSNHLITNTGLNALTGLTALRRLTWHAGEDMHGGAQAV